MDNIPEPIVCELSPRPSFEDWELIEKGADMTSEELHMPLLNQYMNDEVFGVLYWKNLCMRIGLVTGGLLTFEDYDMIQFGVKLHAVHHSRGVPRMGFPSHGYCNKDCYHCNLYRGSLLTEFGFELSKFLGYDGVDASVFDVYADDSDDDGSVFEDYDGDAYGADGYSCW
jgi:hypothetical protein